MKRITCQTKAGEILVLHRTDEGDYCCPVCGAIEFDEPPYDENGLASFQLCSCGFEFGYDDSPLATKSAVDGIKNNWKRWRNELIAEAAPDKPRIEQLESQLKNINIRLAFDLIAVEGEAEHEGREGR